MKQIKETAIVLLLVSMLASCGGKDKKEKKEDGGTTATTVDNGPATKLEGAWEIKRAEGEMADIDIGFVYEFKGTKLVFGKNGITNEGTNRVTDSSFTFHGINGNDLELNYKYHFNGDTMVVTTESSGGQVFYMMKK